MIYLPAFVLSAIIWGLIFAYAYSHVTLGIALIFLFAGVVQWVCGVLFVDAAHEIKEKYANKNCSN